MRPFGDPHLSAVRQKHPHRNLQTLACRVDDRDRAISPLRSTDDLKGDAIERVEWVEDLDVRVFYAQGIVSVDAFIRMCIALFPPVGCRSLPPTGFPHPSSSFSVARWSVSFFAAVLSS